MVSTTMSSRFAASFRLDRLKLYNVGSIGFQPRLRVQRRLLHVPSPFSYSPRMKAVIMETAVSYLLTLVALCQPLS